jgi:SRSO17 transposase
MTRVRTATPTVAWIDDECAPSRSVVHHVRHCAPFTHLLLGLLAATKRQSLPRLATSVQGKHQALQHVLANAAWAGEDRRALRLRLPRQALAGRAFMRGIDEPGAPQTGQPTDYVAPQYLGIGSLHRA